MSVNALFARLMRAASAPILSCSLLTGAALAQDQAPPDATPPADAADTAQAAKPIIQHILVRGTQRVEPATVLSYLPIHEGDTYDAATGDRALKALFATGLFADVKFHFSNSILTIDVVENPIINQVDFEGQDAVSTKDLQKEVQLRPRMVFTRAKVMSDVQRIIELYRRNGKFAASVDPQIIQRPQNRVDLIYSIHEGPSTGVARINFIGNHAFDDGTLREQIATEQTAWWRFLSTNDNYDPDRLTFDREQLRRFYVDHGYADFQVVSAVAELSPDRRNFYITFTISEGHRYNFGKVEINSKIRELDPRDLRPLIRIQSGDVYNAEEVQKAIDALTNAAGTRGYAFAEIHPRLKRNTGNHTIDLVLDIDQGPRVYIDKINIVGNTRTLDRVIRRELRLTEGDAFNRVLVDRSRTRIRALGFFKDVSIKNTPGSRPDRTDLTVAVTEQSTGELSLGAGYSTTESLVGEFGYTERNLFGRGQLVQARVELSTIEKQISFSFTEPHFLDRPLQAGFDLFKSYIDYYQAGYTGDTTGGTIRFGFPTSEYGSVGLRYTYRVDSITPETGAPLILFSSVGTTQTSAFGYSFSYNTLDDYRKPTKGITFSLSQDFAGIGGTEKYLRTDGTFSFYHSLFNSDWVASLTATSGFIASYGGFVLPVQDRYFKGGDSFRGFKLAGIGPRDTSVSDPDYGAVGGDFYAIGTAEIRVPDFLPKDYGVSTALFSDFGTLGHLADKNVICASYAVTPCPIRDNLALRVSAGVSIGWKSPFGPVKIDLGLPVVKAPYDRSEIIHFTTSTGL